MSSNRRTTLSSSRRRSSGSAKLLGAVKLQSPLGDSSNAASPCSSSGIVTPQDRSPLICRPAAAAAAAAAPGAVAAPVPASDRVAQFSQQLATSRSADRWLEEQVAAPKAMQGPPLPRQQLPGASPLSQEPESAASQIVHKALRFITADNTPPPPDRKPNFDSQTFLDKGMDAISGVGKLMEGFAITLDTVIGQAFDWGSLQPSNKLRRTPGRAPSSISPPTRQQAAAPAAPSAAPSAAPAAPSSLAEQRGWADFSTNAGKENAGGQAPRPAPARQPGGSGKGAASGGPGSRQPHITSFMNKLDAASEQEVQEWRKRAQQLATELQRMRAQQEEYQRLRLQYEKLQQDLQQASTQASKLAEENSQLKSFGLPPGVDPAMADPLAAQQVTQQMEALLLEKSKLVQENDRLLRENTGLQELLEFTLVHQAQLAGDGELFGYEYEEGEQEEAAVAAGLAVGSSPLPVDASAGESGGVAAGAAALASMSCT